MTHDTDDQHLEHLKKSWKFAHALGLINSETELTQFPQFAVDSIVHLMIEFDFANSIGPSQTSGLTTELYHYALSRYDTLFHTLLNDTLKFLTTLRKESKPKDELDMLKKHHLQQTYFQTQVELMNDVFSIVQEGDFYLEDIYVIILSNLKDNTHEYRLEHGHEPAIAANADADPSLMLEPEFSADPVLDSMLGALAARQAAIIRCTEESQTIVDQIRDHGASWATIADAAQISHSGAYKRWDHAGKERNRSSQRSYLQKLRGDKDAETDS